MKLIKMLGLAALTALMAMALVGVSSAMAESTALCSVDPGTGATEVCPANSLVSHVHETTLTGTKAKLLTNLATVECEVLFLGDVTTTGLLGNPLTINGHFTYSNCNFGCTAAEPTGNSSTVKVLKKGHETGEVTGNGEVKLDCTLINVHCVYDGTNLLGTAKGPLLSESTMPNGEVRIEGQETHVVSGTNCPTTSKLDLLVGPLTATRITN